MFFACKNAFFELLPNQLCLRWPLVKVHWCARFQSVKDSVVNVPPETVQQEFTEIPDHGLIGP